MKTNPVYKRETMVSARSFRLALILVIFNSILALVILLNMYSVVERVKLTAEIQYSSFTTLYVFVAVVEFVMLMFIMPALTAGSISGERERQTLDILLTTTMKPSEIIWGKLLSSFSTMFLMVVSSFPLLAVSFVYGGVMIHDVFLLLLCYLTVALLCGSMGICFSSLFKRSTVATVVSYGVLVFYSSRNLCSQYIYAFHGKNEYGQLLCFQYQWNDRSGKLRSLPVFAIVKSCGNLLRDDQQAGRG